MKPLHPRPWGKSLGAQAASACGSSEGNVAIQAGFVRWLVGFTLHHVPWHFVAMNPDRSTADQAPLCVSSEGAICDITCSLL